MFYRICLSLVLFILISFKNILYAEEDTTLMEYHAFNNGWTVYIDPTLDYRCLIQRYTNNGSDFRLGTIVLEEDAMAFLAMFNNKWASINQGEEFEISIKFDNDSPYAAGGIGVNEIEPGFMVNITNEELVADFMLANTLSIFVNNKFIEEVDLKGTYNATEKLAECQDWTINTIESLLAEEGTDPFSDTNKSLKNKKNRDPFQ